MGRDNDLGFTACHELSGGVALCAHAVVTGVHITHREAVPGRAVPVCRLEPVGAAAIDGDYIAVFVSVNVEHRIDVGIARER